MTPGTFDTVWIPVSSYLKQVWIMPRAGPCSLSHGCACVAAITRVVTSQQHTAGELKARLFVCFGLGFIFVFCFQNVKFALLEYRVSQAWHNFGPHSFCHGAGPVRCRMCSSILCSLYPVDVSGTCVTIFPMEEQVNFFFFEM